MEYSVGIDEVGRGPIAGPVVVCACAVLANIDAVSLFPKKLLKDSKKLSEKARNEVIKNMEVFIAEKKIVYGIGEVSSARIDEIGIVPAISEAVHQALEAISSVGVPKDSKLSLDGGLCAHDEWQSQQTIIKGDEKIPEIALASILAKVYRDTYMKGLALEFPSYGFENHVGYGTKAHYDAIHTHGMTLHHRKSFLKNIHEK